jgi:RNA polymerase sigma factor (sigma-70 family)
VPPINPAASQPDAGAIGAFVTTQWSVVLEAQGSSPAAKQALEKLCRTYWRPIYSFVRREGRSVEDAQDLTQSFFARLLERNDFNAVRREKGRLRSYLLVSLKHFIINERQRAMSVKRGRGQAMVSLDEIVTRERTDPEPSDALTADRIYERRWALTVLEQVLERLAHEYETAGNAALFDRFKKLLSDESQEISHAQIASEMGMTENAVKQAYHRFRLRYRELLRGEIANTVAAPGDVEDELRHLITILRA